MSKFFNRNWKAGFTLVELIVVIAILAILAGIAIPVYSGYIKKANEAADNQLLAAVNTAFGAACVENGQQPQDISGAKLTANDKRIVGIINVDSDINNSFIKYFGSNADTDMRTCFPGDVLYDNANGVFYLSGTSISSTVASIAGIIQQNLTGSNYEGKETELLDRIQSLTDAAESMDVATLNTMLNGAFGTFLAENSIDTTDMQSVANAAMLFVAEQMSGLSDANKEAIINAWSSNQFNPAGGVKDIMNRYSSMGLSTLGGMAMYYANTEAMVQYVKDNYKDVEGVNQAGIDAFLTAYESLPSALSAATDTAGMYQAIYNAQTQMVSALQSAGNTELMMNIANYGSENAEADATAFMNSMASINGNMSELLDYVGEDNLYTYISSLLQP